MYHIGLLTCVTIVTNKEQLSVYVTVVRTLNTGLYIIRFVFRKAQC